MISTYSERHGLSLVSGVSLASLGYVDDTIVLSNSASGLLFLHRKVQDFFKAHRLELNGPKTRGFATL